MAWAALVACGVPTASPSASASPATPSAVEPTSSPVPITQHSPTPSIESPGAAPTATALVAGVWQDAGRMRTGRLLTQAVLLGDGRTLVVGNATLGEHSRGGVRDDSRLAEIWDPASGTWRRTEGLNKPRAESVLIALRDGRALVVGGVNEVGASYSSAYVFDPGTERWTKTGLMHTARTAPGATVLGDGRVLVVGGRYSRRWYDFGRDSAGRLAGISGDAAVAPAGPILADVDPGPPGRHLATAELYDPVTGAWTETSPMRYARAAARAVTLGDGRAVVCGPGPFTGESEVDLAWGTCEVFDPASGTFAPAPVPSVSVADLARLGVPVPEGWSAADGVPVDDDLVPLGDGAALLVHRLWSYPIGVTSYWRLDPGAEAWTTLGPPTVELHDYSDDEVASTTSYGTTPHPDGIVAPLPDGRVLFSGGWAADNESAVRTAELFDPSTGAWSTLPPMPEGRVSGEAVVQRDGSVLIVGGAPDDRWQPSRATFRLALGP